MGGEGDAFNGGPSTEPDFPWWKMVAAYIKGWWIDAGF
jgi:hypothetical protein